MPPRNGVFGLSYQGTKLVEHCDLIRYCLLNCPTSRRVRRSGKSVAFGQEVGPGDRIANILSGIFRAGHDVSVAVEDERAVPFRWDLNQVGRAIREFALEGSYTGWL